MSAEELVDSVDGVDDVGFITICRDIPGDHTGGRGCFCYPGTFRADDTAGIELYISTTQYGD